MKIDVNKLTDFFKNPTFGFLKSKETLGVDIGSTSIKLVQLQGHKVVRWALKELDLKDASPDVAPTDKFLVSKELIKDFLRSNPKTCTASAISVSGNSVIVRYVKMPKLSLAELNQTIQFEAEPYIPFAIPEVNLGFQVLGDVIDEGQAKMETILVAAKKDLIEQKLDVLNSVGLRPIVVDVDAFTLENAYEFNYPPSEYPETVLLINIGASLTSIIIMENGLSKVVRDVFIAGNNINKSLQRIFDCSFEESEKLKRKGQILVTPDEKEATLAQDDQDSLQISNTIVTVLKDLVSEIQRSLDFYLSQNPERQVNRILLCGGSSNINGLDRYLSQELHMNVEVFDPFIGLTGDNLPDASIRSFFAIAVGLALRKEGDI